MEDMRRRYEAVTFLVVSDDHLTGHSPAVDLAILAIVDYGTFSVWGGVLSRGEVVLSPLTFRDGSWAADYLQSTLLSHSLSIIKWNSP